MHFFNIDLELAHLNRGQIHDTPLGHKQSLSEVETSYVFHKKGIDLTIL